MNARLRSKFRRRHSMSSCTARLRRSKRSWHVSQADEEESPLPRDEEAALLAAVAAAWRPDELDPAVHERLLEMALEDPFAEPSAEEQIESARLRDALEQGLAHADAELLHALGAPFTAQ